MKGYLASGNWTMFPKPIAYKLGNPAALVFSEIVNQIDYFNTDEPVFITDDHFKKQVNLSSKQRKKATDLLESEGLIIVTLKGVPAKNHYQYANGCEVVLSKIYKDYKTGQKQSEPVTFENITEIVPTENAKMGLKGLLRNWFLNNEFNSIAIISSSESNRINIIESILIKKYQDMLKKQGHTSYSTKGKQDELFKIFIDFVNQCQFEDNSKYNPAYLAACINSYQISTENDVENVDTGFFTSKQYQHFLKLKKDDADKALLYYKTIKGK